jgi:hypothetical protein
MSQYVAAKLIEYHHQLVDFEHDKALLADLKARLEKDQLFQEQMFMTEDYSSFEAAFRHRMIWYGHWSRANNSSFEEPRLLEQRSQVYQVLANRVSIAVDQKERLWAYVGIISSTVDKQSLVDKANKDLKYCIRLLNIFKGLDSKTYDPFLERVTGELSKNVDVTQVTALIMPAQTVT